MRFCTNPVIRRLERALRIPALSAGWRRSFEALLEQARKPGATTGNAGLGAGANPAPAWAGFRPLRVGGKIPESKTVTSLRLEPTDGRPLPAALPGQFVVLRLKPSPDGPALLRSYSLSGEPGEAHYRISVKRDAGGVAGAYVADKVQPSDIVDTTAPRGEFILRANDGPVVLLSAGIGATPVLAMLLALAAAKSPRQVWWLYGARDRAEHPFAEEAQAALRALPDGHSHIRYSTPARGDRLGVDFDSRGRLDVAAFAELGVPANADFYLCGPPVFMADLSAGLASFGAPKSCIHTETFGTAPSLTPGVTATFPKPPDPPAGPAGSGPLVSFARSGLSVRWGPSFGSLLELAEACDVPVRWACRASVCHGSFRIQWVGAAGGQLRTIGASRGLVTVLRGRKRSGRSSVTVKKNRSAAMAALIVPGLTCCCAICS
jgi:ferredoxin-NADP reductase